MGMPQLRPRCTRAQRAKPNPISTNPTPNHCSAMPGWSDSERPIDAVDPEPPCRRNHVKTITATRMASRTTHVRRRQGTLLLAFLLNSARTSQQRKNAAQIQVTSRGIASMSAPVSVSEVVELQRQVEL